MSDEDSGSTASSTSGSSTARAARTGTGWAPTTVRTRRRNALQRASERNEEWEAKNDD